MWLHVNYPYQTFSWFTANFETPKAIFSKIVWYIPTVLDTINTWLHEPLVQIIAWIVLVSWFIFRLLDRD